MTSMYNQFIIIYIILFSSFSVIIVLDLYLVLCIWFNKHAPRTSIVEMPLLLAISTNSRIFFWDKN